MIIVNIAIASLIICLVSVLIYLAFSNKRINDRYIKLSNDFNNLTQTKEKGIVDTKEKDEAEKTLKEIHNQIIQMQQKVCDYHNEAEKSIKLKNELENSIREKTEEKEKIEELLTATCKALEDKQAALQTVQSFEKKSFSEEMPYIDFCDYFVNKGFDIVVKLLDDCIKVAPQLKSDLRKIEWSLCYMPYKKQFIKDLSKSGIYALEVKREFEQQVLDDLDLVRVNDTNSLVYIGQALNIYERWTMHIKKMLGIESSGSEKLYKYSPEMFRWRVLEWCDSSALNEREAYWIDAFNCKDFGLNSKSGNKK